MSLTNNKVEHAPGSTLVYVHDGGQTPGRVPGLTGFDEHRTGFPFDVNSQLSAGWERRNLVTSSNSTVTDCSVGSVYFAVVSCEVSAEYIAPGRGAGSAILVDQRTPQVNDPFQMQLELRYGAPRCDQILTGRYFTVGYSWYFRQAKWALEIARRNRRELTKVERQNNFRADVRVPHRFRAALDAYQGSGYDRGHLVASANQDVREVQNSETFLLSNMSPQVPAFNRGKWRELEEAIRELDSRPDVYETYVLTAPVFYFGEVVETIGDGDDGFGIDVPVPHAFVKSVLTEDKRGRLNLWTFEMKNQDLDGELKDYLVVTYDAEQLVGGRFWDRASGGDLHDLKKEPIPMW